MARKHNAHRAALDALIPQGERADYERRRSALLARNATLEVIDATREAQSINKTQLAGLAGLEPSSVRRMLTAQTANPTAENTFRLLAAVGVGLEAVLPSGKRVSILETRTGKPQGTSRRASSATKPAARAKRQATTQTKPTGKRSASRSRAAESA